MVDLHQAKRKTPHSHPHSHHPHPTNRHRKSTKPPKKNLSPSPSSQSHSDHFTLLPDALIITILSLLPLKAALRCSLLSHRFQALFLETPLRLNDASLHFDQPTKKSTCKRARSSLSSFSSVRDEDSWCRRGFVNLIAAHRGPIISCHVSRFDHPVLHPTVDSMVGDLMNKWVEELALSFSSFYSRSKKGYKLPRFLLIYDRLKKLDLHFCEIPNFVPNLSIFPGLIELSLRFMTLKDEFVACIFSSCLNLEFLKIHHCTGLQKLKISSPKLKVFILKDNSMIFPCTNELVVEKAPNLENLMLGESTTERTKVTVVNAPKVEKFGIVCLKLNEVRIGEAWFKITDQYNLLYGGSTIMRGVKSIAIKMNFNDEKQKSIVLSLLQFFPCLESLSIMHPGNFIRDENIENNWNIQGSFDFLNHLKTLTLKGFVGSQTQVDFINFMILRAVKLEKILLLCGLIGLLDCDKNKWVREKSRKFCYKNRASVDLRFKFAEDWTLSPDFSMWNDLLN